MNKQGVVSLRVPAAILQRLDAIAEAESRTRANMMLVMLKKACAEYERNLKR